MRKTRAAVSEIEVKKQTELEKRLCSFLRSPFSGNVSIGNADELIEKLYRKSLVWGIPEDQLLLLEFKAYKAVDHLLSELKKCSERGCLEYQQKYVKRLIKIAYCLNTKTSADVLFEFFTSSEKLAFWQRNQKLKKEIKNFLLSYYNDLENERAEERIKAINKAYQRLI